MNDIFSMLENKTTDDEATNLKTQWTINYHIQIYICYNKYNFILIMKANLLLSKKLKYENVNDSILEEPIMRKFIGVSQKM
jgi:hypothetical protein